MPGDKEETKKSALELGMVIGLAEVRGVATDHISWVDKKSGTKREADVLRVSVELAPKSAAPVQCLVSVDVTVPATDQALLVRGKLVVLEFSSLQRTAGAWSGRCIRVLPLL